MPNMAFPSAARFNTLSKSLPLLVTRSASHMMAVSTFKYDALQVERTTSPNPKPAGNDLTFGKDITDHMLIASWNADQGWSAPKIQPVQPLTLHPTAKTFQFAAHIFEGMKAFHREDTDQIMMFRPDKNADRFLSSARRCSLPEFDTQELIRCIARLVDVDRDWVPRGVPHASLYIRPVLIGTDANFKVGPIREAILYVLLGPVASYFKKAAATKPVRLYADPNYVRAWPGGCGAYKMGSNYGPAVFVQSQAEKLGCEQALWLFGDDLRITEVGSMNVMTLWYNENNEKELVTPPLDSGLILPGVTRDSLLTLARQWNDAGIKVSEREHTLPEVLKALREGRLIEMFGCGTAAVVTPVSEILFEGTVHHLPISKEYSGLKERFGKSHVDSVVSSRLLQELQDIQYGRREHEWAIDVKKLI